MTQQIKIYLFIFSVFLGAGSYAQADNMTISDPSTVLTTLTGPVTFERHVTLVPMICIAGQPCPAHLQPQYYWSLDVTSDGVRYELAQPVSYASTDAVNRAPEGFQIDGYYLREGEEVTLRGVVQTFTDDYGVISEIHSLSVSQTAASASQPE